MVDTTDADDTVDHSLSASFESPLAPVIEFERQRQKLAKEASASAAAHEGGQTEGAAPSTAVPSMTPLEVARAHTDQLRELRLQLAEQQYEIAANDPANPLAPAHALTKKIGEVRVNNDRALMQAIALTHDRLELEQSKKQKDAKILHGEQQHAALRLEHEQIVAKRNEVRYNTPGWQSSSQAHTFSRCSLREPLFSSASAEAGG